MESRLLLTATLTSPIGNLAIAAGTTVSTLDLNAHFDDPQVLGPTVAINTPNGTIPIELFPNETPQTVANFLNYVNSGEYNSTIIHRSAKNSDGSRFVIQGGGYTTAGDHIDTSLSGSGIATEFDFSNKAGTVAMAKTSSPNSTTSEWFINLNDANSFLDAQQFTVFARVIYNGMTVANAINDLPTTPASNLSSDLPSSFPLPIEVAANGTAASNLVTVTASVVPHIFLNATTDNPGLVTPSLGGNNQLSLQYTAGASGIAHVTVTATDLGGNVSSQTFRVHVAADPNTGGTVTVGGASPTTAVYQQPNGTTVTVSLNGPGTAVLHFPTSVSVATVGKKTVISGTFVDPDISITGNTVATKLTITAKGGAKVARIGDVTAAADLGVINGMAADLEGDLTLAGSARTLALHGAGAGAMTFGVSTVSAVVKITTQLTDEIITSASFIKSITAPGISGSSTGTSSITGPAVGSIIVKGAITNTAIILTGGLALDLAKLTAAGGIVGSVINVSGNIGTVTAGSLLNDQILAGITALPDGQPLPNFPTDFADTSTIAAIKVKTSRTANFINTNIAAVTLGAISLGRIQTSNSGTIFGVAGNKIATLAGVDATTGKKFALHKLDDPAALPTQEAKLGFALQDLIIKVF